MNAVLSFCLLIWLFSETKGQIAVCNYEYRYHGSTGYKNTNASYYKCDLDLKQANYGEELTRIDGQHLTGHSDADVKYVSKYKDEKLKTFSSIFCQKFPNLEVIKIILVELELIDDDSLSKCKNLDHLWLLKNNIREFPEYLLIRNSKLTYLRIDNNQLTTLPENSFLNQKELEKLLLNENQIIFLPSNIFRPLVKLEVLYLSDNKFKSINPEWFLTLQNLRWLALDGNQILEIPSKCFASLKKLEGLWLDKIKIKTLYSDSFDGLQNLQILDLSSNEILFLAVDIFTSLKSLIELVLNDNKLTTIHSDSFGIHHDLTKIYLQDNKINSIDPKFIDNTAVSTLNMTNNICGQLVISSRNEIKPNLKKCFDNYQPRPVELNSCGIGSKVLETMVGGTEVKRGMFPWIAALIGPNDKYFCGGTLVSNRKVVTAAHCMEFLARDIKVLLGVHDLNSPYEIGRFPYAVQNIHIHPDWNPYTLNYDADIAVMILTTEVTYGQKIQPICLMDPTSTLASISEGTVVGYGKDERPNTLNLNIPKYLQMPIHQNEDCFLKNYELAQFSSKRTFCGGSGNGTGVCLGDSGSGLVVTDGRAYYLRGIVSVSLKNMTYDCDVDTFSIFTNVLPFTNWIDGVSVDPIF